MYRQSNISEELPALEKKLNKQQIENSVAVFCSGSSLSNLILRSGEGGAAAVSAKIPSSHMNRL